MEDEESCAQAGRLEEGLEGAVTGKRRRVQPVAPLLAGPGEHGGEQGAADAMPPGPGIDVEQVEPGERRRFLNRGEQCARQANGRLAEQPGEEATIGLGAMDASREATGR